MRHVVAAIDDWRRHSGGRCTLSEQTPQPAAGASDMGQERPGTDNIAFDPPCDADAPVMTVPDSLRANAKDPMPTSTPYVPRRPYSRVIRG